MITRDFRIILFAAIIATILFSGVFTSEYYARPLLDEHITLTTTANSTTYSTVGEQITYSYLVTNISPNNHDLIQIVMIDNLLNGVSCPSHNLNAGKNMTCTGIYTISQEDIDRGKFVNIASLSGKRKVPTRNHCDCGAGTKYDHEPVYANTDYTITLSKPEILLNKTGSPNRPLAKVSLAQNCR